MERDYCFSSKSVPFFLRKIYVKELCIEESTKEIDARISQDHRKMSILDTSCEPRRKGVVYTPLRSRPQCQQRAARCRLRKMIGEIERWCGHGPRFLDSLLLDNSPRRARPPLWSGVTSLLLTQRIRVRSPVRTISCLRFFPGFSLNFNTNVNQFVPHSSPVIIWPSYRLYHPNLISSAYGRRRSLTLSAAHGRR